MASCPATAIKVTISDSTGRHHAALVADIPWGFTRPLMTAGKTSSAKATLTNNRPSRPSTARVSSHACEIDTLRILVPFCGAPYGDRDSIRQRQLVALARNGHLSAA